MCGVTRARGSLLGHGEDLSNQLLPKKLEYGRRGRGISCPPFDCFHYFEGLAKKKSTTEKKNVARDALVALILLLPPRDRVLSPSPSGPTAALTMEEVKTPGAMEVRTAVATGSTRAVPRGWRKVRPPVSR